MDKNSLINFYNKIPDSIKSKYYNPNYKNHGIEIPFRMLVCGNSGSMKTNFVLNLIQKFHGTFHKIILVTKQPDEPLYRFLQDNVDSEQIDVYSDLEDLTSLEELNEEKDIQYLVIFDDLVLEKQQRKVEEYFIRARKISGGISCVYLTQSYYKTPKVIRINCNYIILKKISSIRDISLILSEFNLGNISKCRLLEMYEHAINDDPTNFFLIDINKSAFRKNFLYLYN